MTSRAVARRSIIGNVPYSPLYLWGCSQVFNPAVRLWMHSQNSRASHAELLKGRLPMASKTQRKTGTYNKTRTPAGRKPNTTNRSNYTNLRNNFQNKINSYRTLYTQLQGTTPTSRPSPTALNSLGNWINKGAVVHNVTATQINRWSPTGRKCASASTAKNILWNKFGKTPIKAVYKSKTGSYLVAALPTYKGKNFKFPR